MGWRGVSADGFDLEGVHGAQSDLGGLLCGVAILGSHGDAIESDVATALVVEDVWTIGDGVDVLESVEEFAGIVVSFGGIFCARLFDDDLEGGILEEIGEIDGFVTLLVCDIEEGIAGDGGLPCEELEEDETGGVDVGPRTEFSAINLFWRHVLWGAVDSFFIDASEFLDVGILVGAEGF